MNIVSNTEICLAFRRLADWTWQNLGDAHRLKVSFNEETITEYILLQLARQFSGRGLEIQTYTKHQEGTTYNGGPPTGADWAFWFEGSSGRGIEVRIQAKRLFSESGKYDNLNGKGGQITKLVNNANGAIPLYVLYNCESSAKGAFPASALVGSVRPFCGWPFFTPELWGCSVATPNAIPKKNQPSPFEVKQLPWHVLVCGRFCHNPPNPHVSLPDMLAANLRTLYLTESRGGGEGPDNPLRFRSLADLNFEPAGERPNWANALRENRANFELPEGLRGVAILTDKRERMR